MEKIISAIYNDLLSDINTASSLSDNMLQKADQAYRFSVSAIQKLKEQVLLYHFNEKEEEIQFFKFTLPRFLKEAVYYFELRNFESKKPVGGKVALLEYYNQAMEAVSSFFKKHENLYNYMKLDRTDFDEAYFTRDAINEVMPELDGRFCTLKSYELSRILGMEAVRLHLMGELYDLEFGEAKPANGKEEERMVWTDAKVKLIELGYALKFRGSINNGKVSTSKLMKYLGFVFGVDTSSHEVMYHQNIRLRKRKTRTIYLHELIDSIESAMDFVDENPKRS